MKGFFAGLAGGGLLMVAATTHAATPKMDRASVEAFERDFGAAVAANDIAAIERYVAPDWRVIDADGHKITREQFLAVIRGGLLKHDALEGRDLDIRVYGNTAVVTAHAMSKGSYGGQPFKTDEMSTDVLVRQGGRWRCVLTHLTSIKG